jgi:integrase
VVDLRRKHYHGQKFKGFSSRDKALEFAQKIGEKVAVSGLDAIKQITDDPRILAWEKQCAVYGKNLEDAMQVALAQFAKEFAVKESPYMSELLNVWLDDRLTDKLKPIRPRSSDAIRKMANQFKAEFGEAKIKEIDQSRLETYLESKKVSNNTRRGIKNYLGQFFRWSMKKGYHNANPAEKIEIKRDNNGVSFFNAEQAEMIMKEAIKHKELTAYFALCLFGGIRPEECDKMTWETNIKLDTKEIFIQADISKTMRERQFDMNDTLFCWLEYCRDVKPLVPTFNIRNKKAVIFNAMPFDWIQDGMRKSFASHHYAKHHKAEEVTFIMGNAGKVFFKYYKGVIPKAEIDRYWNITPASCKPA